MRSARAALGIRTAENAKAGGEHMAEVARAVRPECLPGQRPCLHAGSQDRGTGAADRSAGRRNQSLTPLKP